jgi:hypothetical protein
MSPSSLGSKNKPNKKPVWKQIPDVYSLTPCLGSSDMNSDLEHEWRDNIAVLIPIHIPPQTQPTGMFVMELISSALWRDKSGAGMTLTGSVGTRSGSGQPLTVPDLGATWVCPQLCSICGLYVICTHGWNVPIQWPKLLSHTASQVPSSNLKQGTLNEAFRGFSQ